jgi:hypothetical protein
MAGSLTAVTTSRKGRGYVRLDCHIVCSGGALTATTIGSAFGRLVAVFTDATDGAGATMTNTADILLTDADTGAPILSDLSFGAAESYRPTRVVDNASGGALTPGVTQNDLNRDIFVAGNMKLAIANATTTDSGLLSLVFQEG